MAESQNDSGYGSAFSTFEDGVVLHRAGTVAQKRHGMKEESAEFEKLGTSTPTTPISPFVARSDGQTRHSRNESWSPQVKEAPDTTPARDASVDDSTPESLNSPPALTKAIPAPYIPLRKDSLNRLQLRPTTSDEKDGQREGRSSPTPSPRLRSPRLSSPPRLPKDRQRSTPSPVPSPQTEQGPPVPSKLSDSPAVTSPKVPTRARGFTTSSRDLPPLPPIPQLKQQTSIPELASFRRQLASSQYRPDRGPSARYTNSSMRGNQQMPWADEVRTSYRSALNNGSHPNEIEIRSSVRSALTNGSAMTLASSSIQDASETERSSVLTRASSFSDIFMRKRQTTPSDEGLSVEDAISLYMHGFGDESELEKQIAAGIEDVRAFMPSPLPEERHSQMQQDDQLGEHIEPYQRFSEVHKSPSLPDLSMSPSTEPLGPRSISPASPLPARELPSAKELAKNTPLPPSPVVQQSSPPRSSPSRSLPSRSTPSPSETAPFIPPPRDRYGFKKQTQYISVEQYDDWNATYTPYLERRRKKWQTLMKSHGLSTDSPERFPPKSDKTKRYIRKGVPPEWRGAAWFWYAGGPAKLIEQPNLYWDLVEQISKGMLSELDREHIERDLNRTFPDNIRFKPDPLPSSSHSNSNFPGRDVRPHRPNRSRDKFETSIVRALRRVLQAFAIHNPSIGYCQSLNFLAGLLLLCLNEDEEKAFILLNIITRKHLPGTHAKVLEANVDIAVLMTSIKESLPAVWAKIDDFADSGLSGLSVNRLPTVSLATTAWFMSLFVGSLPIETVLRVWDSFFYEGSKTLFRIALAIFKIGEPEIKAIGDQLEVFQVVQAIPRKILDVNLLMETCFKRRNGFGHLSQETIDQRRAERRKALQQQREKTDGFLMVQDEEAVVERGRKMDTLRRAASRATSRARLRRGVSTRRPKTPKVPKQSQGWSGVEAR